MTVRAAAALLAFAAGIAAASPPAPGAPVRVLFIGSSLTYQNGLPRVFEQVATFSEPSRTVEVAEVTLPNAGLRRHWEGGGRDRVKEGGWDYVILQPGFDQPPTNYVRQFHEEATKAGAKIVLFGTWAHRGSSGRQRELNEAFAKMAAELGIVLAPVGPAWQKVAEKHGSGTLYEFDGLHPSPMGTYVAACVMYSAIFGKPVPTDGAEEITKTAREAAWEVVRPAK